MSDLKKMLDMKIDDWISACKKIDNLIEQNDLMREAVEFTANQVTWHAESSDGNGVTHTYGYCVDKCREARDQVAKIEKDLG